MTSICTAENRLPRRLRPESPWFDAECHQANKEVRRHHERVYYSRKPSVCYRIWRNARWSTTTSYCDRNKSPWNGRVREAGGKTQRNSGRLSLTCWLLVPRAASPDNFTAQQFSTTARSRHHVMSHSFADDTQLYRHTTVRDVAYR